MRDSSLQVIIMCKAPLPGRVKTRLMTRFTADEAAAIHRAMADTVIRRAMRLFAHVYIAADDPEHAFFAAFGIPVLAQGEGDLGERMARLLSAAIHKAPVLFLGTDSPHMGDARLLSAAEALRDSDIVIGPVEDGGYDLIGLRRDWPVFEGVAWSGEQVLTQTLAHCDDLQLTSRLLETSFDIDTPEDLLRAESEGWGVSV